MNRTKILVFVSVVTAFAMAAVAAVDAATEKPAEPSAEQKVLYKFVGNWRGAATIRKAKWTPQETRVTDTLSCVRILGGRFTQNTGEASDGMTSLRLATYDVRRKCYRMWYFDSRGGAGESQGEWNGQTRTSTWRGKGDNGVTGLGTSRYLDDNTVKWSYVAKDRAGEVGFHIEGKYTRVKQLPKGKDTPAAKPADRSAEQKVLDRFIGTWRSKHKLLKAKWTPVETAAEADLTYSRVLGGKFVEERGKGKDTNKTQGRVMYTYDTQRKSYRLWRFSSTGQASEAAGRWDADTRTLTWTLVATPGQEFTTIARHRFVNDDTFEWDVASKDGKGTVLLRMKGKATRVTDSKK